MAYRPCRAALHVLGCFGNVEWAHFPNGSSGCKTCSPSSIRALVFVRDLGGVDLRVRVRHRWLGPQWLRLRAIVRRIALASRVPIPVLSTSASFEPGVVGIFRPVLLLPAGITAHLTQVQLQTIIDHEMCHVCRRDNLASGDTHGRRSRLLVSPAGLVVASGPCTRARTRHRRGRNRGWRGPRSLCGSASDRLQVLCQVPALASAAGVAGADLRKRIELIMTPRLAQAGSGQKSSANRGRNCDDPSAHSLRFYDCITYISRGSSDWVSRAQCFCLSLYEKPSQGAIGTNIFVGRDNFRTENYSLRKLIAFTLRFPERCFDFGAAYTSGSQIQYRRESARTTRQRLPSRRPGARNGSQPAYGPIPSRSSSRYPDTFHVRARRVRRQHAFETGSAGGAWAFHQQGPTSITGRALGWTISSNFYLTDLIIRFSIRPA